ncbi:MAG: S41 family peptidase, partial [Bacteroidota bacterium]
VSSIARDVWRYDVRTGQHTKLTSFVGEDRSPVFAGMDTAIYYLSEESGSFNIRRLSLVGAGPSQAITRFTGPPVRFLSVSHNGTLCFGYDGEIYVKKINEAPKKVAITVRDGGQGGAGGQHKAGRKTAIDEAETIPIGEAREMAVSPDGGQIAIIFRGEIFLRDGNSKAVRQITHTPGEEADISFSPDGQRLLYAAERDSGWEICETELHTLQESVLIANGQENYQPKYSPDGKEVAYIADRTSLKIYNSVTRKSRIILTSSQLYSRRDHDQYFEWSPDSQSLLVQYYEQGAANEEVGLVSASGSESLVNLTRSGFSDTRPKWAMDGKSIVWLSDRKGLRSYANSSTRQQDVYRLSLKGGKPERLTTQSTLLADALVSRDGASLYYLARSDKGYDLWRTDLYSKETREVVVLHADDPLMEWGPGQKTIFLFSDGQICRIDLASYRVDTVEINGQMTVNRAAERRSMFEHVGRRTKETFYEPGRQGRDWDACKTSYARYLPFINNNYDFVEMLNELLGELNVSHTGAVYHPSRKDKDVTASLGAFYNQTFQDTGLQIEEILPNGPLDNPALGIGPGTVITAIDGIPLTTDRDVALFLNRKAGKKVRLSLRDQKRKWEISVNPVGPDAENELVYQRWVERNERETDSLSHGQLGYVHLYRMNDAVYRNVIDAVLGKYARCKGLVVDTRFNRGGDLAPELTVLLSGSRVRDNVAGSFLVSSEPSFRWNRPSIVLAGEANYSDGSCFVYDYQLLHLGKLVGMPVPGSCTFMTGQSLPDRTLTWSCPTLGVKDRNGNFLENHPTEPDIRIMNTYEAVGAGRDEQLEKAIRELLKEGL